MAYKGKSQGRLAQKDRSITQQNNQRAAAVFLSAIVVADLIYGAVKGREQLVSWLGLLFAALAIIVLFFDQITEFSISLSGGLVVKKARERASAYLEAAAADSSKPGSAEEAASVVTETITPKTLRRVEGATILWVDDRPDNNVLERKALEEVGLRFVLSTSTEDALNKIDSQKFDLIVSDMGRSLDRRAGYRLLEALRNRGDQTPFIVYRGHSTPQLQTEALSRGAQGLTDRPDELFQLVTKELSSSTM